MTVSWYKAFHADLKGSIQIKLEPFNIKSEITGNYDIKLLSNRFIPKLEVTMKIRTPFIDKEYNVTMKKGFQVNKVLPPFKGEGSEAKEPLPLPQKVIKEQPKPIQQPSASQQQQPKPQKPTAQQQTDSKPKESPPIDKSQFSLEELKNPDCLDNLNTMEVLSFKEKQLDDRIKKIEGRTPKELREQLVRIKCKKKVLEEQLGEGALTPEAYVEIIKKQHQHDKQLHDYLMQEGEKDKAALVTSRISLLIKEMNDMIDYLKQNGK